MSRSTKNSNLARFASDFDSGFPNSSALLYDSRSYFSTLPTEIRAFDDGIFKGYASHDQSIYAMVVGAGNGFAAKSYQALAMSKALQDGGIEIIPSGDTGSFFVFHGTIWLELSHLKELIPSMEIIHEATLGAAKAMHIDDIVGSIETGKLADILLLSADPRADVANVRSMLLSGNLHYNISRSQIVVEDLLRGYTGHIQSDEFYSYNLLDREVGITRLGCWTHVRRQFVARYHPLRTKYN